MCCTYGSCLANTCSTSTMIFSSRPTWRTRWATNLLTCWSTFSTEPSAKNTRRWRDCTPQQISKSKENRLHSVFTVFQLGNYDAFGILSKDEKLPGGTRTKPMPIKWKSIIFYSAQNLLKIFKSQDPEDSQEATDQIDNSAISCIIAANLRLEAVKTANW